MKTKQFWEIHERGALHLLQYIPDQSIDLVIADLPYENTKNAWDISINPVHLWSGYSAT